MDKIHSFSHDNITRKAKTIDVIWFNNRKMPDSLFEVEYSTNFQNSLLKFVELQDFNSSIQWHLRFHAIQLHYFKKGGPTFL